MNEIGVTPESLQTYHASQTYSMAMQNAFEGADMSYGSAHIFSMLEVAAEMGHDLGRVEDFETALSVIEESTVDPMVIYAIKESCNQMGLGQGAGSAKRPVFNAVPSVSMTLSTRTPDEEEFSRWLRSAAIHNYLI